MAGGGVGGDRTAGPGRSERLDWESSDKTLNLVFNFACFQGSASVREAGVRPAWTEVT